MKTKYHGVKKSRCYGRPGYRAVIYDRSRTISCGFYDDPKTAAKAYDMAVIRLGLDRPTNFLKKKTCTE